MNKYILGIASALCFISSVNAAESAFKGKLAEMTEPQQREFLSPYLTDSAIDLIMQQNSSIDDVLKAVPSKLGVMRDMSGNIDRVFAGSREFTIEELRAMDLTFEKLIKKDMLHHVKLIEVCALSASSFELLSNAIAAGKLPRLTTLYLNLNVMTSEDVNNIITALENNKLSNLVKLEFRGISEEQTIDFAKAIRNRGLSNLSTLNFFGEKNSPSEAMNYITDAITSGKLYNLVEVNFCKYDQSLAPESRDLFSHISGYKFNDRGLTRLDFVN